MASREPLGSKSQNLPFAPSDWPSHIQPLGKAHRSCMQLRDAAKAQLEQTPRPSPDREPPTFLAPYAALPACVCRCRLAYLEPADKREKLGGEVSLTIVTSSQT
jgi:hypothetical protein